jgi:hypothetical protein
MATKIIVDARNLWRVRKARKEQLLHDAPCRTNSPSNQGKQHQELAQPD